MCVSLPCSMCVLRRDKAGEGQLKNVNYTSTSINVHIFFKCSRLYSEHHMAAEDRLNHR